MTEKSGELKPTALGPNDIRHAQVIAKYEEFKGKDPNLTKDQISKKIAAFFNHIAEISKKYLRKTFNSLDDPLATKNGLGAEGEARSAAPAAPASLSPIQEDSGESSGPGGGGATNAPSGKLTWEPRDQGALANPGRQLGGKPRLQPPRRNQLPRRNLDVVLE